MTRAAIFALPPAQLPRVLYAQGLAPCGIAPRPWPESVLWLPSPDGYCVWTPHAQIAHAWPLVETWQLTIEPSRYPPRGQWWVGEEGREGCYAQTFADIPAAICRAVLLFDAQRTAFEQGEEA